jgi:hypothetical protein
MLKSLFLIASVFSNELKIIISADDHWKMTIDDEQFNGPSTDYSWITPKIIETTLKGNGPWIVGIEATGSPLGGPAGVFAGVYLDGKPYTATGTPQTLFKAMDQHYPNWLQKNFDDYNWAETGELTAKDCVEGEKFWAKVSRGKLQNELLKMSPELPIAASWYPNCQSTGNTVYLRLLIPRIESLVYTTNLNKRRYNHTGL